MPELSFVYTQKSRRLAKVSLLIPAGLAFWTGVIVWAENGGGFWLTEFLNRNLEAQKGSSKIHVNSGTKSGTPTTQIRSRFYKPENTYNLEL
jgi:hypothetical protein